MATQVGHMLRTKLSHVNEGGVAAGSQSNCWQKKYVLEIDSPGLGALDSLYLVDAKSCCPTQCGATRWDLAKDGATRQQDSCKCVIRHSFCEIKKTCGERQNSTHKTKLFWYWARWKMFAIESFSWAQIIVKGHKVLRTYSLEWTSVIRFVFKYVSFKARMRSLKKFHIWANILLHS